MSLARSGQGKGYAVREDEIGRFKGKGFLREGADSPYQGADSPRRGEMAEGQSGAGRWAKPKGGRDQPPLRKARIGTDGRVWDPPLQGAGRADPPGAAGYAPPPQQTPAPPLISGGQGRKVVS